MGDIRALKTGSGCKSVRDLAGVIEEAASAGAEGAILITFGEGDDASVQLAGSTRLDKAVFQLECLKHELLKLALEGV